MTMIPHIAPWLGQGTEGEGGEEEEGRGGERGREIEREGEREGERGNIFKMPVDIYIEYYLLKSGHLSNQDTFSRPNRTPL